VQTDTAPKSENAAARRKPWRGVTLVETLIGFAICSVLAADVFPVLARDGADAPQTPTAARTAKRSERVPPAPVIDADTEVSRLDDGSL
jgi:hypothetical protein